MKKQLFIQFVILDPQFVLHILWLWQGRHSLPYLSWRHVTDFLSFRILNNLRLSWKTELPWTALKYFLSFRVLEQLALVLKTEFDPEMFHCIEYTFYIQGYWATCACSGKQSLLWNLSLYWNIFYLSGFLRNLRLSWKQSLPRIFQARGAAAPPPASYATVNKHSHRYRRLASAGHSFITCDVTADDGATLYVYVTIYAAIHYKGKSRLAPRFKPFCCADCSFITGS